MKNVFLGLLAALVTFSQIIVYRHNDVVNKDGVPVLYWATDQNPTRQTTVNLYRAWLKKNGYPDMDIVVDNINGNLQKIIIQGAAGVGPDIMNVFGWDLQYLDQIGMVETLDPLMKDLPVPSENHDPMVSNELWVGNRRIGFSQNAGTSYFFANLSYIKKLGVPLPPLRWTISEFEEWGRVYVEKANQNRPDKLRCFVSPGVDWESLCRSAGISIFNETLTACVMNRPETVRVFETVKKWQNVDHFIPSQAERDSFTMDASAGGGNWVGLMTRGYYAMGWSGLPFIIGMRENGVQFDLGIAECPSFGYRNSISRTYAAAIYSGSPKKDLARYFLLYLTQEPHNLQIADNGDQMPPIRSFRERDAFLKAPGHSNEWEAHRIYKEKAYELGTPSEYSPFVHYSPYQKKMRDARDGFMSGVYTAPKALAILEDDINNLIQANLNKNANLRVQYQNAKKIQAEIDQYKAAGKPVPLHLVSNPFLYRYFKDTGRGI